MKSDTWMAFYVGNYVANTMHLTARQHGAYLLLICAAWKAGGVLPSTDTALASIAKLSPKEWKQDGETLKAFLTRQGDRWIHERVMFEWMEAQRRTQDKSNAGKAGARKLWDGRRQANANGNAMAVPSAERSVCDAQSQSHTQDISEAKASGAKAPMREVIFQEGLPWLMRRSGLDDRACRGIIGKWLKEYGDEPVLAAMQQAEQENPVDPVPWIVAKFKPRETHEQRRLREIREVLQ